MIVPTQELVSVSQIIRQEKPKHALYLNKFRSQQCPMFLDHKCQYHRPFTCFNWHFPNQKRRQPFKRADGTFNYNPDVYCTKYDENSGMCPNGEECVYVHRNAGDTERRYHPRYFKTGMCIYETTESGACAKNGAHCAFAHGPDDVRMPLYDVREVSDAAQHTSNLPASLEKERVLSEDPKWNDMKHVLAHYKTEPCKKPPRMCRQGYACPFHHNGKDKRRNPRVVRYRSTPCPAVKPGDEWKDSSLCEAGDNCAYCHTRTEQQFHPEIYKSTKCNDMLHNGYCPRGPFCAFAHIDDEMNIGREFMSQSECSLASYLTTNEGGDAEKVPTEGGGPSSPDSGRASGGQAEASGGEKARGESPGLPEGVRRGPTGGIGPPRPGLIDPGGVDFGWPPTGPIGSGRYGNLAAGMKGRHESGGSMSSESGLSSSCSVQTPPFNSRLGAHWPGTYRSSQSQHRSGVWPWDEHHMDSILGNALDYQLTNTDLNQLDSWPDEVTTPDPPLDEYRFSPRGSTEGSAPVSIPGAAASPASSGLGSFPCGFGHAHGTLAMEQMGCGSPGGSFLSRLSEEHNSGHSPQGSAGSFTHLPQSPILMNSPFSNPSVDLERLVMQREIEEYKQRLSMTEDELKAAKRERDMAMLQLQVMNQLVRQQQAPPASNTGPADIRSVVDMVQQLDFTLGRGVPDNWTREHSSDETTERASGSGSATSSASTSVQP